MQIILDNVGYPFALGKKLALMVIDVCIIYGKIDVIQCPLIPTRMLKLISIYRTKTTSSKGNLNRGPQIPSGIPLPTPIIIFTSAP